MSILSSATTSFNLSKPLTKLINQGCFVVGGVYNLNYHTATVLTDDHKKREAGGIPEGGFLLAAAGEPSDGGFLLDDQEIVLLRVRGTASLPHERELTQLRLAVVRDAGATGQGFTAVQDQLTRDELQQSAFECDVLGTFYSKDDSPDAEVFFGADIDNVIVSARYQVYLPSKEVLSWLASFPNSESDNKLEIGKIRYSATQRRAIMSRIADAPVLVHIDDFIGRKTAVFGMTRAGKSNTIKTLVTATHQYASENDVKIGQIIFDPQGEYARTNDQDGTAVHLLGDDDSTVKIYKIGPDSQEPKEKPLCFNFYDPSILPMVWEFVADAARGESAGYITKFRSAGLDEPDQNDFSARNRWTWARVGLYALIASCGFSAPSLSDVWVSLNKETFAAFDSAYPGEITFGKGGGYVRSPQVAKHLAEVASANLNNVFDKWHDDESSFKDLWNDMTSGSSGRLVAGLKSIRSFHDARARGDVVENVWNDMVAGRLVIVDLSIGSEFVTKLMSERIVSGLLDRSNELFRDRKPVVRYQVIVEEAHNLFERGGQKRTVKDDPWVRLSKEAAKYKVGLMYATQEVTSVDERILSNTSNWLIAHLNNDNQTKELAHYYDFGVWAKSLIRSEDVGFVRMKTYSGKYIVPTQIAKFDHDMINQARKAAGLAPIEPPAHMQDVDMPADSAPFDLFSGND